MEMKKASATWVAILAVAGFLAATAGILIAKDWWIDKPYQKWSKKDVSRMLDNSPWGKIHTVTIMNPTHTGARTFESIGTGDLEREKQNQFHIRFLSAKPIRMAIARSLQLNSKGRVNVEALQNFVDTSEDKYIAVILTVTARPVGSSSASGYNTALMSQRTPDLASNTTLATDSGKRVYLANYQPPGRDGLGARYLFPRTLPDGSPLLSGDDKEIRFETVITLNQNADTSGIATNPESASQNEGRRTDRVYMQFDLRKMIFDGKLEI